MGKAKYAFLTMLPLAWLVIVTMSAGYLKIFSPVTNLGFLSHAQLIRDQIANNTLPVGTTVEAARRMISNDMLDAGVAAFFLLAVVVILVESGRSWIGVINKTKIPLNSETPYSRVVERAYGD
jgi:carbon starvation protein